MILRRKLRKQKRESRLFILSNRILRNGINYYGRKINQEEGAEIIKQMIVFINKINILIKNNNKK